jgi:hypothetical protein
MQHLGADDEMRKVLLDLLAVMSPEDRIYGLSPEQLLQGVPPEERVKGLSPEDRLKGLSPEEMQRLKELLQRQAKADDSSNPK